jgi:predicted type IV restriction endonuclease
MLNELGEKIEVLKNDKSIYAYDEADTQAVIIDKFLSILGWDIFNAAEVNKEYKVKHGVVDYAVLLKNNQKIFIEAKQVNEPLIDHKDQIRDYSIDEKNVIMSVLTNGISWWFYLPYKENKSWEEKKFYAIDIENQDGEEIINTFVYLLLKENVENGKSLEIAEELYKGGQKTSKTLNETIPKAWDKIIDDADEIIELLIEKTESLCGIRPDIEMVEKFFAERKYLLVKIEPEAGDYTGKSIKAFHLQNKKFEVKKWKDLLVQIANILYTNHGSEFFDKAKAVRKYRTKNPFITDDRNVLNSPEKIGGSKFYIETAFSANTIIRICQELLSIFGYPKGYLTIDAV